MAEVDEISESVLSYTSETF